VMTTLDFLFVQISFVACQNGKNSRPRSTNPAFFEPPTRASSSEQRSFNQILFLFAFV